MGWFRGQLDSGRIGQQCFSHRFIGRRAVLIRRMIDAEAERFALFKCGDLRGAELDAQEVDGRGLGLVRGFEIFIRNGSIFCADAAKYRYRRLACDSLEKAALRLPWVLEPFRTPT